MQLLSVLYSLILNLGIACAAGAPPHDLSSHGTRREAAHHHHRQASRAVNTTHHEEQASKDTRPRMLQRRFDGARFTYYDAGLGACGKTNTGADFIVALTTQQWDGGKHCFEFVTITVGGKTVRAQIVDECPGCPYGGLDFAEGLFTLFAPTSEGVLSGSWSFGSTNAAPPPPPPPPPPPKTISKVRPTTTALPPPPMITQAPEPKSTSKLLNPDLITLVDPVTTKATTSTSAQAKSSSGEVETSSSKNTSIKTWSYSAAPSSRSGGNRVPDSDPSSGSGGLQDLFDMAVQMTKVISAGRA